MSFTTIKFVDNALMMTHLRLEDIVLTEDSEDEFSGLNSFNFEMHFTRSNGMADGFEISNFGAKQVKFLKLH